MKESASYRTRLKGGNEEDEGHGQEGKTMSPPSFSLTAGPPMSPLDDSTGQIKKAKKLQEQLGGNGPQGVSDPKAIIPIADLIRYVKDVEASNPRDGRLEILTRIRRQYYGGIAFCQLIPAAPYSEERSPKRTALQEARNQSGMKDQYQRFMDKETLRKDTYDHLTARGDENGKGDNPSPYILLANGEMVDLGHLLLGLDALAHPETSAPFSTYGVPNIDPSSWVADLGIAAVWMEKHETDGSAPGDAPIKLSSPDLEAYYQMSAPEADLLGDVDSFGMATTAGENPKLPLSGLLEQYYNGKGGKGATVDSRWRIFCEMNALKFTGGSTVQWNPDVMKNWTNRINRFNDLFGDGQWRSFAKVAVSPIVSPKRNHWKYTSAVLSKFLNFVKTNLEAELRKDHEADAW